MKISKMELGYWVPLPPFDCSSCGPNSAVVFSISSRLATTKTVPDPVTLCSNNDACVTLICLNAVANCLIKLN